MCRTIAVGVLLVVLIVLGVLVGLVFYGRAHPNQTGQVLRALEVLPTVTATPSPTATPSATATPSPTLTPTPVPALLEVAGSGNQTTQRFTAPSEWRIDWNFDCSQYGRPGEFVVRIAGSGRAIFSPEVNQAGSHGSGTDYEHASGSYYLTILSQCRWHVRVMS